MAEPLQVGVDDLLRLMLAEVGPLPAVASALSECRGAVAAEAVLAPIDLPRFTNSAMDGFAFAWAGAPGRQLEVVGRALAGEPWSSALGPDEAVAIATGAVLPSGADTVVPVELAELAGDRLMVPGVVPRGSHVRLAGEDVRAGSVVMAAGTVIGPGQLAACAALGIASLMIHPRISVAVVPTGSEVRMAGAVLGTGDVHDAVSLPLRALIEELGAVARLHPPVADRPGLVQGALARAADHAQLIITVGGISAGERDLVKRLDDPDGQVQDYRVALRPARPFGFGCVHGRPVIALPGNPGAALASFEVLARPVILAMLGRGPHPRIAVPARLAAPLRPDRERLQLVRMQVWREGGSLRARPAGRQGSGMLHSLAAANAWARLPPGSDVLPPGSEVGVELITDPYPVEPDPIP